ncbi:MAG: Ig-like domain-containing protein, partial [Chitinophagales bacterium]|nr:Ig-like domain-containing protein [Chitinophagales bacterium]
MVRKFSKYILLIAAICSLHLAAYAQVRTVQQAEVFFNTDPGPGNGIPLVAVDGSFNNAIEAIAGNILTMLGSGTHTINVRVKDNAGNWGPVFKTVLSVGPTFTPRDIKITAGELFFNTDPGEGNGVALVAFDGMFNDAVETVLGYVGILPGLGTHVLHVRVRDHNNVWSTTFKTVLHIGPTFTPRDLKITAGEMFFNTDPGLGLGIPLLAFDGLFNDAVEEVFRNSVTHPGIGLHTMGFRVKDVAGNWSPTFRTVINVTGPFTPRDIKITQGEMFFNTDPGLGLGIPVFALDGTYDNAIEEVFRNSVTHPGIGLHTMGFRVKDLTGNWSPTFRTVINVTGPFTPRDLKITAAEYFIDTDPGAGLASPMLALDGSFDNAIEAITRSAALTVDTGLHVLGVRARDVANNWGPVFRTVFYRSTCTSPLSVSITPATMQEICEGDSVLFSAPNGFVAYKWFRGATLVGTGQTYWAKDTGFYRVLATLIPGCEAYSEFVEVKHKTHTVSITPATVTICSGESATLTASASVSYLWSTGATTASITVSPPSTTTYTVTATGSNGCAKAVSRTVTVNPLPAVSVTGPNPICIGGTTTVSPTSGGTWVSWHSSVATVTGGGAVTASASLGGVAKLTFTQTSTGCSNSLEIDVRPLAQIVSDDVICFGSNGQLIPTTGGTWVSSNPSVAAVSPAGVVTPLATGTATFTFTESGSGCVGTTSAFSVGTTSTVNTITNTGFTLGFIVRDNLGYMYIADRTNNRILRVTPGGVTSVYCNSGLSEPTDLAFDTQGYLYVTNYGGGTGTTVSRIPPGGGPATPYATGFTAPFNLVRYDGDTLLMMEYFSKRVYRINPGGGVAGTPAVALLATPPNGVRGAGVAVFNNKDIFAISRETGSPAYFYRINKTSFATTLISSTTAIVDAITTVKLPGTDTFFVSSYSSQRIFRVNGNTGAVTTVAGSGTTGNTDGASLSATLTQPYGLSADVEGNIWFTQYNGRIRKHNECKCTPSVSITGPSSICVGDTTKLSPTLGGTWVSNNPSVASVSSSGTVTGLSVGSATFTFTNPGGCSATTGAVTVNAVPTASISPATATICFGNSITLTASGGVSYTWSHGLGSGASKTVSPTSTTTYTVTVTNASGCTATASRTVTVNPLPSV